MPDKTLNHDKPQHCLPRNPHPDADWYFQGGNLGLFIHYGLSTVSGEGDLSWGMMDRSTGYKPASWVYDSYRKVRQWDGNMLINVGPLADGSLPAVYYERIRELGALMGKINV